MKLYLVATGKVQGVMFRQTIIRAAEKRKIQAGATNLPSGNEVAVTLVGDEDLINEIVEGLTSGRPINSWGAFPSQVEVLEQGMELNEHQVTTDNVDDFKWSTGVEFYL